MFLIQLIQLWPPSEYYFFINFADFSACLLPCLDLSLQLLSFFLSCIPFLVSPAAGCLWPLGLTPAKLMNGYMVLTNGGSQPRSSPSYSPRTLSRPTGDIVVNMDTEPSIRKMDTVVKLDAVSFFFDCINCQALSYCIMCVFIYVNGGNSIALLSVQSFFTCLWMCHSFLYHPLCVLIIVLFYVISPPIKDVWRCRKSWHGE